MNFYEPIDWNNILLQASRVLLIGVWIYLIIGLVVAIIYFFLVVRKDRTYLTEPTLYYYLPVVAIGWPAIIYILYMFKRL